MSELQNKQRIYDLTSELEALKPKADAYKKIVTDIADTVAGYVETSNDPKEAYEVLRAVVNIIFDDLVINISEASYILSLIPNILLYLLHLTLLFLSSLLADWLRFDLIYLYYQCSTDFSRLNL